jgi:cell division protein FtsI/penicillin-binding protein 2
MKQSLSYYKPKTKIRKLNILLLCFFVALLIIGVFLGEVEVVIQQATTICLSCIGIG